MIDGTSSVLCRSYSVNLCLTAILLGKNSMNMVWGSGVNVTPIDHLTGVAGKNVLQ